MTIKELLQSDPSQPLVNQGQARIADKRDERALDEARHRTAEALRVAESHLGARPYLGGDTFTMGDIPLGCAVWRWMMLPIERPPLPNLKRWFDGLTQRPAYQKIVMQPLT